MHPLPGHVILSVNRVEDLKTVVFATRWGADGRQNAGGVAEICEESDVTDGGCDADNGGDDDEDNDNDDV
jgi:hypothetical protein